MIQVVLLKMPKVAKIAYTPWDILKGISYPKPLKKFIHTPVWGSPPGHQTTNLHHFYALHKKIDKLIRFHSDVW